MSNQPHQDLKLGREYISTDEDVIFQEMVNEMEVQVKRMYAEKKMLRQVHTKMHGCVKGKFVIEPNLEDELKIGVFGGNVEYYHCWIRFSNASTEPKADKKKDIRGIAIKLLGVPGEKLLNTKRNEKTHDFLLMSSETFFSKNVKEFRKLLKAATAKSKIHIVNYLFLNPKHWGLTKRLFGSNIKCDNPLNISYWSTQPYRFGASPDKAVKYFLKPSKDNVIINENVKEHDYLKVNLAQTLNDHVAEFDFYVQFQTDPNEMPIEDPTVAWDSEFIKVATLVIPAQEFDRIEQIKFGENLSFNSWHVLPEHRPLGSFNRARKRAYEAMSKFRHEFNDLPDIEPTDDPNFLSNTHIEKENRIPHEIPDKNVIKKQAQVLVDCSKVIAYEFISSGEELPNWLKKVGKIPSALNAKLLSDSYNKVGDQRIIYFDGGDSVQEELISVNPHSNYSYKASKFTNIIRKFSHHAYSEVWFDNVNDQTRITWNYSYAYKGLFSKLALKLILSLISYKKFMQKSLENAKHYIENGD